MRAHGGESASTHAATKTAPAATPLLAWRRPSDWAARRVSNCSRFRACRQRRPAIGTMGAEVMRRIVMNASTGDPALAPVLAGLAFFASAKGDHDEAVRVAEAAIRTLSSSDPPHQALVKQLMGTVFMPVDEDRAIALLQDVHCLRLPSRALGRHGSVATRDPAQRPT